MPPIPEHHLLLLVLQVALVLVCARLLGELAKRFDEPAVIGELLAGLVLGPSVFGWIAPETFAALFPHDPAQFHLLELLGWLGMVLLMLMTGLETDVRRLRHLGRAALMASVFGMIVPFVLGFGFAMALPADLLAHPSDPAERGLFAAFFATAMAISAMPVIAKILRDMDITRRDIGVLILTAGVVDDTAGWMVLSVIAGLVSGRFSSWRLLQTIGLTAAFIAGAALVLYPAARWLFRFVGDRFHTRDNDLALVVVIALLASAATDQIGIHPVFGAFVAGCVLRQVPRLRHASLHRLESVVVAIFTPLFFGLVGLKMNLRTLDAGGVALLVAALGMATAGKLVGCTAGGLLGRLSFWEALSVGVGMNARGAMGLVVALIGLNLGILSPAVYAMLVVVALATSFMAPVGLRFTLRRVAISDAERARMAESGRPESVLEPGALKALLLTSGGPNALAAARLAATLLRGPDASLATLYVESGGRRLLPRRAARARAGEDVEDMFAAMRAIVEARGARFDALVRDGDPAQLVAREAARDVDLVLLGVGRSRDALRSSIVDAVLARPATPVVLVHAGRSGNTDPAEDRAAAPAPRGRVLALSDGSHASRAAVELAVAAAEAAGAELTVLHVLDAAAVAEADLPDGPLGEAARRMLATTLMDDATPRLRASGVKARALVEEANPMAPPLLREAASGDYDLVVLGADHRAVRNRLSTGYEIERLVQVAPCEVAVVVPRVAA